ncbi:MAG: tripartite tricarboxylate transporter permease [Betaproteobacteria bacterium]|nr:tripartite tricarboxylate transporter permease [Betaproteobacteria bacterium]
MEDILAQLGHGFAVASTLKNLLMALAGAFLGTVVGVLPGLGPTAAMSLLLPLSFTLDPIGAVILLAGVWYGSQYGGSTTAILLNMPGEATSVVTAYDGYQMALKGRAGAALFVAATGSFVASVAGLVGLAVAAPALASFALKFGPPEYFALALLGFIVLFNVTGGPLYKSALMAALGMMVSCVGLDKMSGTPRFTFGSTAMMDGIDLAAIVMGVYGISEVMEQLSARAVKASDIARVKLRDLYPTRAELRRSVAPIARGSLVGFLVGLVPGPAGVISTFLSYRLEKRVSRHPEEFGHGAIEGVAGPEAANNAVTSASLIPLLSLGLPFSAPAAVLLTGFMIHGVTPGPMLIQNSPDLFWGLVASMVIGNIALLVLNLPLVGVFASLIAIPKQYLVSVVCLMLLAGAYAATGGMVTVWVAAVSGVLAWWLRPYGYDPAPFVLGLVLGPLVERSLRRSLAMYDGDITMFAHNPLAAAMLTLSALVLLVGLGLRLKHLLSVRRTQRV